MSGVKALGSTREVHLKLGDLSMEREVEFLV